MSELTDPLKGLSGDALIAELNRRKHDKVMIYNPTDEDFELIHDSYKHIIPNKNKDVGYGKGRRVVDRYLGMHYLKKMTDMILMREVDQKVEEENKRREKAGQQPLTPWQEQPVFEQRVNRFNDEDARFELAKKLFLGVTEYFGRDGVKQRVGNEKRDPVVNKEMEMMASLEREIELEEYNVSSSQPIQTPDVQQAKNEAVMEIAKNE